MKSERMKAGYSVGYQVGSDFARHGLEISPNAVARGVRDAVSGALPPFSPEEMRGILVAIKRGMAAAQAAASGATADGGLEKTQRSDP